MGYFNFLKLYSLQSPLMSYFSTERGLQVVFQRLSHPVSEVKYMSFKVWTVWVC